MGARITQGRCRHRQGAGGIVSLKERISLFIHDKRKGGETMTYYDYLLLIDFADWLGPVYDAAPYLLEGCKVALPAFELAQSAFESEWNEPEPEITEAARIVAAAVAKAKGES